MSDEEASAGIIGDTPTEGSNEDEDKGAIDLAYPLAIAAYDEAQRRSDVTEKRLQDISTVASAITLGALGFSSARQLPVTDWPFVAAIGCALLGLCVAFAARITEQIAMLDLTKLWDQGYVAQNELQFKRDIVCWAGYDRNQNEKRIRKKSAFLTVSAGCFLVEIILLTVWVALAWPSSVKTEPVGSPHPAVSAARSSQDRQAVRPAVRVSEP
jgi:hypothetical protein